MNILFVTRVTLPEGERGNAEYSNFVIRGLREAGHTVRVAVTVHCVKNLPFWDAPAEAEERGIVAGLLREQPADMLLVNYSFLAPVLDEAPAGCLRAVLTHDARHLRHKLFLEQGCTPETSAWSEEEERGALARAELIIAIQGEEADEFRRLAPHAKVAVLPCCFPLDPQPVPKRSDCCLFIGSDADHNAHGILWFIREVWPLVRALSPAATLNVCGGICNRLAGLPDVAGEPGLVLHGRMEDLGPHFRANAVGLAPLLVGSGCKLKLVESLAKGRPCVATPCGAQGLEPGGGVLVASSPTEFAVALGRLFMDRQFLEAQAHLAFSTAQARFNPHKAFDELFGILADGGRC